MRISTDPSDTRLKHKSKPKPSALLCISLSFPSSNPLRSFLLYPQHRSKWTGRATDSFHYTLSLFLPCSCGWTRPRRRSTTCCGCSCSRSWSCSTPIRARSRSTPTRSTRGRWRTWSRGCRSGAPCWSRGWVSEGRVRRWCQRLHVEAERLTHI